MRKVLNLGLSSFYLSSSDHVVHNPIIAINSLPIDERVFENLEGNEIFVITSKSTVTQFLIPYKDKISLDSFMISIGSKTTEAILKSGYKVTYQASNSTQEGMIELLKLVQLKNKKIILPRSNLARKVIDAYLIDQKIPFETIDCYCTQFNPQHVKSNLNEFDALLFTSPSTVKFFFDFYTEIPSFLLFLVIGDITYRELIKSKNLKNKIDFINK